MSTTVNFSELEVGSTIILNEANSTYGLYSLVKKEYNEGKSLLWRNESIGSSVWSSTNPSASYTLFSGSELESFILSWYSGLPDITKDVLTSISYPVSSANNDYGQQEYITSYAATVSANELGLSATGLDHYGTQLSYYNPSCDVRYWTRQPFYNQAYVLYFNVSTEAFATAYPSLSCGVRPTVGVPLNNILATYDFDLGGYWLSVVEVNTPPSKLYLSGTEQDYTNHSPNTGRILSWDPPASGTVEYYQVHTACSDSSESMSDTITDTEYVASAPPKGYMTNTFTLYTKFADDSTLYATAMTRSISTKNSNVWVYTQTPYDETVYRWYLANVYHGNGTEWVDANGMYYYSDSGAIRLYGLDSVASYSVEQVSGSFALNSSGFYESQNHDDSTCYICKINIVANGVNNVYIDYINSGENRYDYGLISKLNTTLTTNDTYASENVHNDFHTESSTEMCTLDLGVLSKGEYYLYALYRKDASATDENTNDSLQFKVRFA